MCCHKRGSITGPVQIIGERHSMTFRDLENLVLAVREKCRPLNRIWIFGPIKSEFLAAMPDHQRSAWTQTLE